MILQIYMRGGAVFDMEVHSYEVELNEFGTAIKSLKIAMYEDSLARLEYVNESQIIAIMSVKERPRQVEGSDNGSP